MNLPPPPPPGTPPPAPPGYTPAGFGYGYPAAPRTDGMAVAAMVCGIVGFVFCGVPSIVGLILGFVAKGRIDRSNGQLTGKGMAITGIVLGFVMLGLVLVYVAFVAVAVSTT